MDNSKVYKVTSSNRYSGGVCYFTTSKSNAELYCALKNSLTLNNGDEDFITYEEVKPLDDLETINDDLEPIKAYVLICDIDLELEDVKLLWLLFPKDKSVICKTIKGNAKDRPHIHIISREEKDARDALSLIKNKQQQLQDNLDYELNTYMKGFL